MSSLYVCIALAAGGFFLSYYFYRRTSGKILPILRKLAVGRNGKVKSRFPYLPQLEFSTGEQRCRVIFMDSGLDGGSIDLTVCTCALLSNSLDFRLQNKPALCFAEQVSPRSLNFMNMYNLKANDIDATESILDNTILSALNNWEVGIDVKACPSAISITIHKHILDPQLLNSLIDQTHLLANRLSERPRKNVSN